MEAVTVRPHKTIYRKPANQTASLLYKEIMSLKPIDQADLVMFTMYHREVNFNRGILISDIDELIELTHSFRKKHEHTNWEDQSWEDAIIKHYNLHAPINWNKIT